MSWDLLLYMKENLRDAWLDNGYSLLCYFKITSKSLLRTYGEEFSSLLIVIPMILLVDDHITLVNDAENNDLCIT